MYLISCIVVIAASLINVWLAHDLSGDISSAIIFAAIPVVLARCVNRVVLGVSLVGCWMWYAAEVDGLRVQNIWIATVFANTVAGALAWQYIEEKVKVMNRVPPNSGQPHK